MLSQKILRYAWPNPSRDALLRAVLLPNIKDAVASLEEWVRHHDLDELNFADHRLLAAICERLGPHIKDLPEYPRLKGLQRQLWTQSRIRLNANLPMLTVLVEAGIEIMLLKGAARLATDKDAQRQRSQQDVDILVRQDQMQQAARLLSEGGWRSARGDSALAAIARADTSRAINFQQPPFGDIDLHRRAYHGGQNDAACDRALWRDAQPAQFLGLNILVPCPAERLTMMLAHGARSPEAHSDWLIDAAELIKSTSVDWDQVAQIIRARNMVLQAAIGLSYLQHIMRQDFAAEACHLLSDLRPLPSLENIGNLLIAREETRTATILKPLRSIWLGYSCRQKRDAAQKLRAPLILRSAKHSKAKVNIHAAATAHNLEVPSNRSSKAQTVDFEAKIRFQHPGVRRRVEFELNSERENLARFRVILWQARGDCCEARLSATLQLCEMPEHIKLETRLGTALATREKDYRSSKYAQIPFEITQVYLR